MEDKIKVIQEKLLINLERLDKEKEQVNQEIARSNAVSQLANTFIKSCNLEIRLEETKVKNKTGLSKFINREK